MLSQNFFKLYMTLSLLFLLPCEKRFQVENAVEWLEQMMVGFDDDVLVCVVEERGGRKQI